MLVAFVKEQAPGERRVALVPESVRSLEKAGLEVALQAGAGEAAGFADAEYDRAGARVEADAAALLGHADVILKVQAPNEAEIAALKRGGILVGFLRPLDEPALASRLADAGVTSFATAPRSTAR